MNFFKYLLFLPFITLIACGHDQPVQSEAVTEPIPDVVSLTDVQIKTAGITLGTVTSQNMQQTLMLNGVVDVPPQNTVSVSFPIAAFLKSTSLLPGMHISKGETIAVMEDAVLIQMQQDYL